MDQAVFEVLCNLLHIFRSISIVLPNDFAEVLRAPTPLLEDVEGQALACPSD